MFSIFCAHAAESLEFITTKAEKTLLSLRAVLDLSAQPASIVGRQLGKAVEMLGEAPAEIELESELLRHRLRCGTIGSAVQKSVALRVRKPAEILQESGATWRIRTSQSQQERVSLLEGQGGEQLRNTSSGTARGIQRFSQQRLLVRGQTTEPIREFVPLTQVADLIVGALEYFLSGSPEQLPDCFLPDLRIGAGKVIEY